MSTDLARLQEIFATALNKSAAAERDAFLEEACGQDSELRRQVEALLEADQAASSFLPLPDGVEFTASLPPREAVGETIGPYTLVEKIGEGGFGVVFLAEQRETIRRRVALKVLKAGMDTYQVIARFQAERQALALMDHPNIAKVLDAGTTATGRPYFVMELVKGIAVTTYCDQCSLPTAGRLELFVAICQAVQHAHQKGVIHRDIKPSNVLVAMQDGAPTIKVIDFGVAKAINQRLTDQSLHTGFRQLIGTPLYMSPEQAEMSPLEIDTRGDVYSLGVLLYELLTGTTPFERERLLKAGFDEMRRIIREEEPPLPSTRLTTLTPEVASTAANERRTEPRRLTQSLRGDLDWIVMKCLEKDRTRRYETAAALAADIEHYMADEPVTAAAPSGIYRVRKFARRHRRPLAVAASVLAILLITAVFSSVQWVRATKAAIAAREAEDQAVKDRDEKEKQRQRAEQSEVKANHNLYIANMHRIRFELENNNVNAARSLLDLYRPRTGETVRPGWEWYYWDRVCHAELQTLKGHKDRVMDVAYSPDGALLASAGGDGDPVVKIWDSVTGEELRALQGHEYLVSQVAFSPDGTLLATCSAPNGSVKLWEVATWTEAPGWKPESEDSFSSVAFSPNGKTLALSDSRSKRVRFWDLVGKTWAGQLPEGTNGYPIQYSPDGKLIAGVHSDGVQVWDVNKSALLHTLTGHSFNDMEQGGIVSEAITGLAFSPDGRLLATCSRDGTVKIRKVLDGTEVRSITVVSATLQSQSGVNDLAFSPDGKYLATIGVGSPLKMWEIRTGRELRSFYGQVNAETIAFSPDGMRLASAGFGGELKIWDAAGEPGQQPFLNEMFYTSSPTFSPDGKLLAENFPYGMKTGQVRVSDAETGRVVARLDHGLFTHVTDFAFSSNGTLIAAASYRLDPDKGGEEVSGSAEVHVWDPRSQQLVGKITAFSENIYQLAFSPDDKLLATVMQKYDRDTRKVSGQVKVWDAKTWKEIRTFPGIAMAFRPSGTILAVVGNAHTATLVDLETGQVLRTLPTRSGRRRVDFSPDGNQICDGSAVWDISDGRQVCVLQGNTTPARFSPNGLRLFSLKATSYASSGLLQVWDAATGDLLATIPVQAANGPLLHPDGWRCAVSGIPTGTWILDARPLTAELRSKRDAQNLVAHLVRLPLLKDEIVDQLKKMKTINELVRREALALAAHLEPASDLLAAAAWDIVQYPNQSKDQYRRALEWLEEANRFPPKNGDVLSILGLALYRMGRFEEAIINLESAYKINMSGYYAAPRRDLICLAMAQHGLNRSEEARKTLVQSRESKNWGLVPAHLVREAETLVEGKEILPNN